MPLPKALPADLIDDLRELAHGSFAATFPNIELEDTIEWDAAGFIAAAAKFLQEIAEAGGPLAARAQAILNRLE